MKLMVALTFLALALSGCNEKQVVVSEIPEGTESLATASASDLEELDPGDVEATVAVELTLDPASAQQTVAEELRNAKKKLSSLTLTSSYQLPAELWISIQLKTTETFAARPTVLRGTLYREVTPGAREAVSSFQTVLDGFSAPIRRKEEGEYFPMEFRADVLKGLQELPASMLVFAEVSAFMSPTGTDPATLDQATYTTDPESTGALLSNPVRINFVSTPVHGSSEPTSENPTAIPPAADAATAAPAAVPAVETPAGPNPFGVVVPTAEAPAEAAPVTETPAAPEASADSANATAAPDAAP